VFFFYILFGSFTPNFGGRWVYPNWTVAHIFHLGGLKPPPVVYPFSIDVHPETWENDSYIVTIDLRIFLGVVGTFFLCILAQVGSKWEPKSTCQEDCVLRFFWNLQKNHCKDVELLRSMWYRYIQMVKYVTLCMEILWTWKEQKIPCTCEWWLRRPRVPLILKLNSHCTWYSIILRDFCGSLFFAIFLTTGSSTTTCFLILVCLKQLFGSKQCHRETYM